MSNAGAPGSKSPPRPGHQLVRSVSELPPLTVTRTQQSHHSLHPHLHRRNKEEKGWPSAGQTLSPDALDISRSEGLTPVSSKSGSARVSSGASEDAMAALPRRTIGDDEVKREKERAVLRAKELNKSIADLYKLSHETTRQLDNTYYSVLEKVSTLQSTIASLKDLAMMMRSLESDFKRESEDLIRDMETQLGAFGDFKEQQRKLKGLEGRITLGRQKVQKLGARVENVRKKVERWELMEEEWQQRMRKRLRVLWSVVATILVVVVGLLIFHYTPTRTQGSGLLNGFNASNLDGNASEIEKQVMNGSFHMNRPASDGLAALRQLQNRSLEEDARLRAFDEL